MFSAKSFSSKSFSTKSWFMGLVRTIKRKFRQFYVYTSQAAMYVASKVTDITVKKRVR